MDSITIQKALLKPVLGMPTINGSFWCMPPSMSFSFWTVGIRLHNKNLSGKAWGIYSPQSIRGNALLWERFMGQEIFEVYYPKIKPPDMTNPDWLVNFKIDFQRKYYDKLFGNNDWETQYQLKHVVKWEDAIKDSFDKH